MKLLKIWEGDRIIRHFWAFREENHSKKNNPSIAQKQVKLTYYSVSLNNWHENHVHHENPNMVCRARIILNPAIFF
jgi:vacuolar-type H+-ATPase catalytic subunit A/Vma1